MWNKAELSVKPYEIEGMERGGGEEVQGTTFAEGVEMGMDVFRGGE